MILYHVENAPAISMKIMKMKELLDMELKQRSVLMKVKMVFLLFIFVK